MSTRLYLFGFSGRINRAKIWLFILIAIATAIVAVVIAAFGFDWTATLTSLHAQAGHVIDYSKVVKPGCKGTISLAAFGALGLIVLAYIWAALAIYAKRLHDRGKSAWWLLAYVALPIVLQGVSCHSLTGPYAHSGPNPVLHNLTLPGQIAYWAGLAISIWVFIDLYCLKGSKGANRFGPDPLEPNWCDPEKPVKGCVPKPMKP